MILNKWIVVVVAVGMGSVQAWDSGTLQAPVWVQGMIGLAILAPAVAVVATDHFGWHAAAVALAFVLLTVARLLAPVPLPTLGLVAFFPAMIIFLSKAIEGGRRSLGPEAGAGGVKR
jgi:hypothetical protein